MSAGSLPAVPLKLRPSVRRWRFCAQHHREEEGGEAQEEEEEQGGISQRRPVRLDAAQLALRQRNSAHMRLPAGRAQRCRRADPESPAAPPEPKLQHRRNL